MAFVQYYPERKLGSDTAHPHVHSDLMNTLLRGIWFERQLYGSYISSSVAYNTVVKTTSKSRPERFHHRHC